jgi:hypothetical protein
MNERWQSREESRRRILALMDRRGWDLSDLSLFTGAHITTVYGWIRPESPAMPSKRFRDKSDRMIEEDGDAEAL